MRAVALTDSGLKFHSDWTPAPRQGEIPVRVLRAGICETDLQLVRGYMNFRGVLGHEFVGIAEDGPLAGQRVAGEINAACETCAACLSGRGNHCPRRSVLGILNRDGAFADRLWLPQACLHPLPDSISNDEAVFIEPLAAAFQIPAQLDLSQFPQIIVLGDGRLGNLCAQVLKLSGCDVLCIGKHRAKLDRLSALGIRTALLNEVAMNHAADLVVDCTGSASGFTTACQLVRPRGTIVLKTTVAGGHGPNLAAVVIDEITLVGSRCGPFPAAIHALAARQIDVASLITARYPIEEAEQAFSVATQPGQMKVLLHVSDQ